MNAYAYVETLRTHTRRISKIVRDRGVEILNTEKSALTLVGDPSVLVGLLGDLKHDFPLGYIQGWMAPTLKQVRPVKK